MPNFPKIPEIDVEKILPQILKLPVVKVDREKFLRKELKVYYPEDQVNDAIIYSPAYAGIPKHAIDKIAKNVIKYETTKVTSISFAAGIPGGLAMVGTIPADITQYFTFILRVLQKLAYLYSFPDFELNENNINDETLNKVLTFMGVMFGVNGANVVLKAVSESVAKKVAKDIMKKPLTKGVVYPAIKDMCKKIGIQMTKPLLAESAGKVIPVVGAVVSGGISFASFYPCSMRLRKSLRELPICDPETYEHIED